MQAIRIVLVLLLFPLVLPAQISKPGIPPGFTMENGHADIPFETFYLYHVAALQQEDAILDSLTDIPWRFGENLPVNLGLDNAGVWDTLPGGERLWRLGVQSPGAYSLNLTFDRYRLPPGAALYVYSADRSFVLGAFTELNNQEDHYFATTLIPGDALIIEYMEPSHPDFKGELNLETVTHAYRSVMDFTSKFGRSGACNLNVACEEAEGWEKQVDAVLLMMVGSNSLCTGTLINNTNFDGRPYILSANHCYRNPSTLVFWFNWQSPTCENPSEAPPYDAMSGAVSLVRQTSSDAWLIELHQRVPVDYNPYYAGWNRTLDSVVTGTVTSIHHPRGDIKKFSYALDGVAKSRYVGEPGSGDTHWRITWSGGTTTEPSSSGAPLFNPEGQIIGHLHGGYAHCGNTLPDWYGRFGISWDAGSGPESSLRYWLDPYNTDAHDIYGYRPVEETVDPPENFSAATIAHDAITLTWKKNEKQHPVVLAYNTEGVFGQPNGGYTLGDTLTDGGVIFYIGHDEQTAFKPGLSGTNYHFMAWSYNSILNYSAGVSDSATSGDVVIEQFPYQEDFAGSGIPFGWYQQPAMADYHWRLGWGNDKGRPSAPFSNHNNLYFFPDTANIPQASPMLISPEFDLSVADSAELVFYFTAIPHGSVHDHLTVYFRESGDDPWVSIKQLSSATSDWTRVSVSLAGVTASVQLAFQAVWLGGYGICLDQIRVNAYNQKLFPPPRDLRVVSSGAYSTGLEWLPPDPGDQANAPVAYNIFRNNLPVARVSATSTTQFTDTGLPIGNHSYYATAVYEKPYGESAPGNRVSSTIPPVGSLRFLLVNSSGQGLVNHPENTMLTFNQGAPVSLSANPHYGYIFNGWYEGDLLIAADSAFTLTMDRDYGLTAHFTGKKHQLELSAYPHETGQQQGGGIYEYGQSATVSTTVPLGLRFLHWEINGEVVSTNTEFSFPLISDVDLTAYFETLYHVELIAEPPEGGHVSGGGIYTGGSLVSIHAEPDFGWIFIHWVEGDDIISDQEIYHFVVDRDRQITGVFGIPVFEVKLDISHPEAGVIFGGGQFFFGDTVNVSLKPRPNWIFTGWFEQDSLFSDELSFTVIVESDRHFTARMEPRFYTLTIEVEGEGQTFPEPGTYFLEKGYQVRLSAKPLSEWKFKYWDINGVKYEEDDIDLVIDMSINALAVFFFPVGTNDPTDHYASLVRVYPNPGTGRFFLDLGITASFVDVEVYHVSGQLFGRTRYDISELEDTTIKVDLTERPAGVYLLRVSWPGNMLFRKLIKQ